MSNTWLIDLMSFSLSGLMPPITFIGDAKNERTQWLASRREMEARRSFVGPDRMPRRHSYWIHIAAAVARSLLRLTRVYPTLSRKAAKLAIRNQHLTSPHLPRGFDGYRIAHLSDLHLDVLPQVEASIRLCMASCDIDLLVMTGDFSDGRAQCEAALAAKLADLRDTIGPRDGWVVTFGNHDTWRLAPALERHGAIVLTNQSICIAKGDATITITGIDDPSYFYTDRALEALQQKIEGYRIAAVHSPELADYASMAGCHLYLCGHTHGGQICRRDGRPIYLPVKRLPELAAGLWQWQKMAGYTNRGAGTSLIPVRLNCQGEVAVFSLHCS